MRGFLLWLAGALTLLFPAIAMAASDVFISVDSPFVPGLSVTDVYRQQLDGRTPELPAVRIELDDHVVFEGRLVPVGSPKSHLSFAVAKVRVRAGATIVVLRFSIEARGLRWERRVDLRKGAWLVLTEGMSLDPVVLEQAKEPRRYL